MWTAGIHVPELPWSSWRRYQWRSSHQRTSISNLTVLYDGTGHRCETFLSYGSTYDTVTYATQTPYFSWKPLVELGVMVIASNRVRHGHGLSRGALSISFSLRDQFYPCDQSGANVARACVTWTDQRKRPDRRVTPWSQTFGLPHQAYCIFSE